MNENNLPDLEDSPWLNLSKEEIEDLRKQKQQLTEYGKEKIRELQSKKFAGNYSGPLYAKHPDLTMTHEEMLEEAAKREAIVAKVSDEDLDKVMDAAARQELAKKPFKDLTDQERIQLALEELDWIVVGGQDGEEFYNSIQFIRRVLKSFR